ncbi:MAG TPA: arginase family protein [Chitinophagaceae bacterium]|nr:arginase family protein [Chitinophagaceae bacterium]
MAIKEFIIINAPSNLGLIEPAPGIEPGVKFLPGKILDTGFAKSLGVKIILNIDPPPYTMHVDEETKIRNAHAIREYSTKLGTEIAQHVSKEKFQIVLGGDCSILIGCMLGLKTKGSYGLFYMDGHTDYMLPEHSGTAGAAGMDLALVSGNGPQLLSNIESHSPYVLEEDIYCYGNREYETWYVDLVEQSNIHYFDLESIRAKGIAAITQNFLDSIIAKKLEGFWIHLDVDVLDDALMPCVDSRTPDGLTYEELSATLIPLISSPLARGINITILDPTLDPENTYLRTFCDKMLKIFNEDILQE